MSIRSNHALAPGFAQRGSVLLVSIVLLVLASLISLFALKVGTFEQTASGNDLRSKLVQQMADTALTQGAELITANGLSYTLGANWELCNANDTTFPCGAVPQSRRGTMYRYVGCTATATCDAFGGGAVDDMERRMLPLDRRVSSVNNSSATGTDGFTVNYGVGAVLCRLRQESLGGGAACSVDAAAEIKVHAVTLVGVASIPNEGARATAVKTFSSSATFALSADSPPIVTSGPVELRGNIQIVTSPNAAGPGVPVSVWTRRPLDAGGTPDTCYADEFYRSATPTLYPSTAARADQVLRCDDCDCSAGALTAGQGNSCSGGMDVLASPADCSPNQAVQPNEFPCDLFEHVFGVKAWQNSTDTADNFCETRITMADPTDASAQIGVDENYLFKNASFVITDTTTGFGTRFAGDGRVIDCSQLVSKVNGRASGPIPKGSLVWVRTGECGDGLTLGTPKYPVILVHDGNPSFQNMILFGVLFVRSTGSGPLSPTTGGNATFRMNAGSAVYGSVIVQGEAVKVNGTAAVIYDRTVLSNLAPSFDTPTIVGLPASWSDSVRY